MTTFIAICRGHTIDDSRLLALSTDPDILKQLTKLLLGENYSGVANEKSIRTRENGVVNRQFD